MPDRRTPASQPARQTDRHQESVILGQGQRLLSSTRQQPHSLGTDPGGAANTSPISAAPLFALETVCQEQRDRARKPLALTLCAAPTTVTLFQDLPALPNNPHPNPSVNWPGPNIDIRSGSCEGLGATASLCRRTFQLSPPHAVASSSTASAAAHAPDPPGPTQFPRLLCTSLLWHHDIACFAFTAHPIGLNPYLLRWVRLHTSNGPDRDLDTSRARISAWTPWGILYDTHLSFSI